MHEAGGRVVLSGQRVGRNQNQIRAAGLERAGQVGRLGGDVQTSRHLHAGQRLLFFKPGTNRRQHRHIAVGPHNSLLAARGQLGVLDVALVV